MSLYMVSVPIGHPDDITLRAIDILKKVDFLVCEELKIGRKLMNLLKIEKPLVDLNEHNETEFSAEITQKLLSGLSAAYFSDAGTPLFADPGTYLVKQCRALGIRVVPVPGPSSLTAALSVAGVDIRQFYYAGFLPRVSEERRSAIQRLSQFQCPVIIYDTPYRLKPLLQDLRSELPATTRAVLLLSLTQPEEQIVSGSLKEIINTVNINYRKREFVLILDPQPEDEAAHTRKQKSRKNQGRHR